MRTKLQTQMNARTNTPEWDGTGKHPILGLTMEEIKALNEQVTDTHAADRVPSPEKIPSPKAADERAINTKLAAQIQEAFYENLSNALTTRQS